MIKQRLRVYLPFVTGLREAHADFRALDLGCGRGEWLELLAEQGLAVQGVDRDDGMLDACRERALDARKGDALEFVRGLADESVTVVTAFHMIEHLEFDEVRALVREALRVLQPGGLLILETPNPENVVVGCTRFYLDPTHRRPIPPQLLSFLAEYYGYERVKVLRLQEAAELHGDNGGVALLDVLGGVSPDYAVVARKRGDERVLAATEAAFAAEHGVTLESLAARYDRVRDEREEALRAELGRLAAIAGLAEERVARAERRAREAAEGRALEAEERAARAEGDARDAEARAARAEAAALRAEERAERAENEAREAAAMLDAVLHSRSWRVTRLLRVLSGASRGGYRRTRAMLARLARPVLGAAVRAAHARPRLMRFARARLAGHPRLQARLRGLVHGTPGERTPAAGSPVPEPATFADLSPRARKLYLQLQAAIEHRRA
ncbi:MAG TPA: class I SAM-dependent methyltransferase [Burkholderiales bacterium]